MGPDLRGMAERVLAYFSSPNATLQFTSKAKELFVAFGACFSTKSCMLRDLGEDDAAPRAATGAWHLAVLSGASLVFDISIGEVRLVKTFFRLLSQHLHYCSYYYISS